MGWTHYWHREIEMPEEKFKAAVKDCKEILSELFIQLGDAEGNNNPVLTDDAIIFNGANSRCDPFVFRRIQYPKPGREKVFTYCKTEHLPYDLAVQCCLIVLKHHLDNAVQISSDGKDDDWKKARDLCEGNLHYGLDFVLNGN
jgi:hypothetical protein